MTYTLGLDLGSASIGWAMTSETHLLHFGVRLFPKGLEDKSREPKNQKRRAKRLARRQIARKAQRREIILRAFQRIGWLPTEKAALEKIWLEDPYALRKKGLDAPLSKSELARAFFHLAKHRGFKSNRKVQSEEEAISEELSETEAKGKSKQPKKNALRDGDEEKQGYGEVDRLLKSGAVRTIGEYLASLNPHEVRIRCLKKSGWVKPRLVSTTTIKKSKATIPPCNL